MSGPCQAYQFHVACYITQSDMSSSMIALSFGSIGISFQEKFGRQCRQGMRRF